MRVVISRATLKIHEVAAIDQEALSLVASILSNAQTILKKPKVELKEIQALKPAKEVRPVPRYIYGDLYQRFSVSI